MRLEPIMNEIDATIHSQLRLADPSIGEAAAAFLEAFRPAMKAGIVRAVEQAAVEVNAALGDHTVDVKLVDGEPELAVSPPQGDSGSMPDEEMEARITLRLPGSLKAVIEDAASTSGDSINGWVVDALRTNARRRARGSRVNETFEL